MAKKAKKQNMASQNDEGPTPEELRRRQMRAGRFGSGAVDHSLPGRAHAPVYAVCAQPQVTHAVVGVNVSLFKACGRLMQAQFVLFICC